MKEIKKLLFKCLIIHSGETEVLILQRENAILKWREILGPTKVFKAIYLQPDSLRGLFGLTDTRNACHGSDSPHSVSIEIKKVFPDFVLDSHKHENKDEKL